MSLKTKPIVIRFIVWVCLIILSSQGMHGVIVGNYSEIAFNPGQIMQSRENIPIDNTLAQYIIEGGVNLLASKSRFDTTLQMIEACYLNRFNDITVCPSPTPQIENIRSNMLCALASIDDSMDSYQSLVSYTRNKDYNKRVLSILAKFKYVTFFSVEICANGSDGNQSIYQELYQDYLVPGNIHELYQEILRRIQSLRNQLNQLKNIVDNNDNIPELIDQNTKVLPLFWRTSQDFAAIHLLGQYVSEVFAKIDHYYFYDTAPYWTF